MNLNFLELLAILQLITIQNSSDSNNIKPQAIKRLVKLNKFGFYNRLLKVQLIIFSAALECTKKSTLQPLAQKGCAPLGYSFLVFLVELLLSHVFLIELLLSHDS